ncbi:acyltransferase [Pelagibacteraceae bacterium]|nr:acyltransferase [Pelagibacteraceae bacterium]
MKRYFSVEILRFLTSISVLLYHYRHFFSPLNFLSQNDYEMERVNLPFYNFIDWFYNYGFYGVHVFYTISGFVFAHVYLKSKKDTSLKEFSINRIARLYPLHLATLLFVAFSQITYIINYGEYQFNLINDFYHFFLQLLFISSWGFENGHSFNAPIWSVSVEIGIYILFFFLIQFLKKYELKLLILISITLILIDKLKLFDTLFLECARLFFSGSIVYFLVNYKDKKIILFILSLILLIFSFIGNFKTFVFCPALLLFFLSFENHIKKEIIQISFGILGNLTYALYLLHVPFQLLIIYLFEVFLIDNQIFSNVFFFLGYFTSLCLLALIVFKFYEKPLNKALRKRLLNV